MSEKQQNYTPYQQKIIKRYYDNSDTIQLQRLSELVGELYLSTGKKKEKAWVSVAELMRKMGVKDARVDHLVKQAKPELIAQVVKELEGKK